MIDETKEPTISTAIIYLLFLLICAGCLYLFALGVSGEFGQTERKPWEISTSQGRDHTTGHGYYLRRAERGR